ncbi:MAG: 23S rRNA (adenine(2503)-C(2))-methyltransferase RlmN [Lachnospiraceae bacterium]|nr:23S rRNA (adenine(2503)-C(2))-methyltransferase RlmN [Lachnospiraceae bacterium]
MMDLKSLTKEELEAFLLEKGEKKYRAAQLYEWMHRHLAGSFEEMGNLPKSMKEMLAKECVLTCLQTERLQISKLDGTRKYLFALSDGQMIESVWMPYHHGNSVCISSQAGCRMGCKFCASGIGGLVRNLTPSEMLDQIYRIQRDTGERVSNVVVMGTGEPLDNYDNLMRFLQLLTDENGLHISQRNVTVSTCGLVEQIRALAQEKLAITLALSLHAPTDEKRKQIMPIAHKYTLDEVVGAVADYGQITGRRVTFEYSLIAGVNDSDEDVKNLSELALRAGAHVNLIPVNPVTEAGYRAPDRRAAKAFADKLEQNRVNATIRRTIGADIDAACGQLRRKVRLEGED